MNGNAVNGFNVNNGGNNGRTLLHVMAESGYQANVKNILDVPGVDVNNQDEVGKTPLHLAASQGHSAVVQLLLRRSDVSVNLEDNSGRTPLHWAAGEGQSEVVVKLVENTGVLVNCKDATGMTPLHCAAEKGHFAVVKTLISKMNTPDVNEGDNHGRTPLHLAAEKGHVSVIEEIFADPDVYLKDEYSKLGLSALHLAVKTNQEAVVQVFLKTFGKGYFMKAKFRNGKSPMYMAALYGYGKMVKMFQDCDILIDSNQMTALHWAAAGGHRSLVKTLLLEAKARADPSKPDYVNANCKDFEGRTPLHLAVFSGQGATAIELLKAEIVDVNCIDTEGKTPLHLAVEQKLKPELLVLLKERRTRLHEDSNGKTALEHAFEGEQKNFVRYMSESDIGKAYLEACFKDRQVYVDASNAILVGAALIAGVTFAAWLQPPLGYSTFYEETLTNPYPGPPTSYPNYVDFEHYKALQAFWVFNSLSFFFSTSTVVWGARSVLPMQSVFLKQAVKRIRMNLLVTAGLMLFSIFFGIISFAMAGYIVLPPKMKYQANIFSTVAVGGVLCLTSLFFLAKSIIGELKLMFPGRKSSSELEETKLKLGPEMDPYGSDCD